MTCPRCMKIQELCFCDSIRKIENHVQVVILQHPQEPDKHLGTAKLAELGLTRAKLRIGLSWPNLKKAVDDPEARNENWAVLYLGSGIKNPKDIPVETQGVLLVDKKGSYHRELQKKLSEIRGLLILDGTWSQAKALWWRNPWLLKLNRLILAPQQPSLYKELRREPRRECLSTIEAIGEALSGLEDNRALRDHLNFIFQELLKRYRQVRPKA